MADQPETPKPGKPTRKERSRAVRVSHQDYPRVPGRVVFTAGVIEGSGIIINPAAFTFTSMAIMDALKMFPGPLIELHISNIHKREPIYHRSYISPVATAVIAGLGARGYPIAVEALLGMIASFSTKA